MAFVTPLRTEWIEYRRGFSRHRLLEPLVYQVLMRGVDITIIVPAGWVTDFASVPRVFQWIFPSDGDYTKAAVLHDYLCELAGFDGPLADAIFRAAMKELDVKTSRRIAMYYAVRLYQAIKGRI